MGGTFARFRLWLGGTALVAALAAACCLPGAAASAADAVEPLKTEDCDRVRRALEIKVPFAPGFRRLTFPFPKNDKGVEGRVCRLLTLGTGIHMEGPGIASLKDMGKLIEDALKSGGWRRTTETQMFAEKTVVGRDVFALAKDEGICAATIVVGMVDGVAPAPDAVTEGKVRLGKLRPHEREWWISVDCFTVPGLKPMAGAPGAAPAAAKGGAMGAMEKEVPLPAPEPLDPAKDAFSMPAEPMPAEPMPAEPMPAEPGAPGKDAMSMPAEPMPADPDLMKDLKDGPLPPEPMPAEPGPKN